VIASPDNSGLPLYAQIANELRARIMDGTYGPGALLPSRNELAEMYSVSVITARDALAMLGQEGLAQAIRGPGSTHRAACTHPRALRERPWIRPCCCSSRLMCSRRSRQTTSRCP
jgi:GntR family transcriptional regulator